MTAAVAITTQQFRKDIAEWLKDEKANQTQALMLLDAIHGGVIEGRNGGDRYMFAEHIANAIVPSDEPSEERFFNEETQDFEGEDCSCLLGTFEEIKPNFKAEHLLGESSKRVFWFATMIPFGATPSTNKWARAAARGIEDYIASL